MSKFSAPERIRVSGGGFLWLRVLVLVACVFIIWLAVTYTPESPPKRLVCLVKQTTGYSCPACGITRGLTALGHGRIGDAHRYFPMILPVVIGLFIALIGAVLPDRCWRELMAKTWLITVICLGGVATVIGMILFWVLGE